MPSTVIDNLMEIIGGTKEGKRQDDESAAVYCNALRAQRLCLMLRKWLDPRCDDKCKKVVNGDIDAINGEIREDCGGKSAAIRESAPVVRITLL